jgi:hypothetical protein
MITYTMMTRSSYRYTDDTRHPWSLVLVDYLAAASNLERAANTGSNLEPLPPNFKPRHIKLVAIRERPGMQKYRTELVVNDNDFTKYLDKIFVVNGVEMRCIKFIGEERRSY